MREQVTPLREVARVKMDHPLGQVRTPRRALQPPRTRANRIGQVSLWILRVQVMPRVEVAEDITSKPRGQVLTPRLVLQPPLIFVVPEGQRCEHATERLHILPLGRLTGALGPHSTPRVRVALVTTNKPTGQLVVPIGALHPRTEGLHRGGHKAGPHITPAVELAGLKMVSMRRVLAGHAVVPVGARQPTFVMFHAIVGPLLKSGAGVQLIGHIDLHKTPVVEVAPATRINPKVQRVVPTGARHELDTRVQRRGQNRETVRGTQIILRVRVDEVVAEFVVLALIQPVGHLVVPRLPWHPPRTLVKFLGHLRVLRVHTKPETVPA